MASSADYLNDVPYRNSDEYKMEVTTNMAAVTLGLNFIVSSAGDKNIQIKATPTSGLGI